MRRPLVFYGWYIVAAGMLIGAYNTWAFIYGFTAFINPIAATSGWSIAHISLATSMRGLEVGAFTPFLGMAIDRWPAKRLVLVGIIILGLGAFCLSRASNLAIFYASFLILGIGGSLASYMVPVTTIVRWFRRDMGKASGIHAMGIAIGGVLIPLLVKMIDTYGWQNSLIFLAVGIWALGIPLAFVFRTRPEDYGLLPDGKPQYSSDGSSSLETYDYSTGVKEALKMQSFWYMGVATAIYSAAWAAVSVHMMPYLDSIGVERSVASMIAMALPLASLGARMPFGFLADIFRKTHVMAFGIGLTSVGVFLFWLVDGNSLWLMILSAVIVGIGISGFMPVRAPMLREYFGTKNFGTILGLTGIFHTVGMVAAPPLAGWVFDTSGDYHSVWLTLGIITLVGAVVMAATPSADTGTGILRSMAIE